MEGCLRSSQGDPKFPSLVHHQAEPKEERGFVQGGAQRPVGWLAGMGSLGLLGILLCVVRHVVSPTAVAARVAPRGAVRVLCREVGLACPFSVKDILQRKCAPPSPPASRCGCCSSGLQPTRLLCILQCTREQERGEAHASKTSIS